MDSIIQSINVEDIYALLTVLLFGCIYFMPTLIANFLGHRNTSAIFILNLLFGWTFIGWAGSLIWALCKQPKQVARY